MKLRRLLAVLAAVVVTLASVRAQDPATDLKQLVSQITTKLQSGHRSAADLKPELEAFDALLAKYKDQKTDAVAQIAMMRATLYIQVLGDMAKGTELLKAIKTDFAGTQVAAHVDRVLEAADREKQAITAKAAVIGKPAPELNFTWSSRDDLKKLSDLKGKVVVLDFWATWCGPCIRSFPEVRELVEHYKGSDVVVLGVTSIQGRVVNLEATPINTEGDPQKEISLMPAFIKAKEMTWPVAFSEESVFNPDYGVTGIPHMAIIAPDGTVRHNGIHPAAPSAEKTAKIDALLKEFKLKVPAEK